MAIVDIAGCSSSFVDVAAISAPLLLVVLLRYCCRCHSSTILAFSFSFEKCLFSTTRPFRPRLSLIVAVVVGFLVCFAVGNQHHL